VFESLGEICIYSDVVCQKRLKFIGIGLPLSVLPSIYAVSFHLLKTVAAAFVGSGAKTTA
jgi:hypothetical protein